MKMTQYTPEERSFLKAYVPGHTYKEIQKAFTERFWPISFRQIKAFVGNNNLNTGKTGHFEKGHVPYNKGKHCRNSPETEFKPGHIPHNHKPVGSEVVDRDGYLKVKVAEPNVWKYKHRLLWEQTYGKIPEGHLVVFRDGNKRNIVLENLALISKSQNAVMNRSGISKSGEAFGVALLVAKLAEERAKKRRRK